MDAWFLKEFVVGVYLIEQCLGVGVAYLTALLHHLGHVTGHTQGGRAPFLLVLDWGQFDTLQVQSSTTWNNKIQMYLVPAFIFFLLVVHVFVSQQCIKINISFKFTQFKILCFGDYIPKENHNLLQFMYYIWLFILFSNFGGMQLLPYQVQCQLSNMLIKK